MKRRNRRTLTKDFVTVICYGKPEVMRRKDAIAKFREGVASCEGSERDRYVNILLDLTDGKKICKDIH